jgi:hypothetical protein
MSRLDAEASSAMQITRKFLQLWNPLLQPQLLIQFLTMLEESLTHRLLVQSCQFVVDLAPEVYFSLRIGDIRNLLAQSIIPCNFGYMVPPLPVLYILELRMLLTLVDIQQHPSNLVHVLHVLRKPWNSDQRRLLNPNSFLLQIILDVLKIEMMVSLV